MVFALPDEWNAKLSQHEDESSYRISKVMPTLINWNVVSSRLRKYLFNNGTESNWLCRERRESRQAKEQQLIPLWILRSPFRKEAGAQPCAPQELLCPLQTPRAYLCPAAGGPVPVPWGGPGPPGCSASAGWMDASPCPRSVLQQSSAPSHGSQTLLCYSSRKEFKLSI